MSNEQSSSKSKKMECVSHLFLLHKNNDSCKKVIFPNAKSCSSISESPATDIPPIKYTNLLTITMFVIIPIIYQRAKRLFLSSLPFFQYHFYSDKTLLLYRYIQSSSARTNCTLPLSAAGSLQ